MENKVCPECEKPMEQDESVCPACGGAAESEAPSPEAPKLGMKWHSFLCGWLLIMGILGILLSAIGIVLYLLTGPEAYEFLSPGLFACAILRNVITIGCGVLMIFAWLDLSNFRKDGPRLYMFQYGLYVVLSSILDMVENGLSGQPVFPFSMLTPFVVAAVFLWLNHIYFRKRAHLYVN